MKPAVRIALWATAAAACIFHASVYGGRLIDDAFITFTYSKHIAMGMGPVFTAGQRVEATSSMLWAAILAPFEMLGIRATFASKALGLTCFVSSMFLGARLATLVAPPDSAHAPVSDRIRLSIAALIAMSSPLALWSFYGMENGLVALLLILAAHTFLAEVRDQKGFWSVLPIALLEAARPEGFVFVAVFIVSRVVVFRSSPRPRGWLFGWLLMLLVPVVSYELWGFAYYGHWLPNTVAAKLAGSFSSRVDAGLHYTSSPEARTWRLALAAALVVPAINVLRARGRALQTLRAYGPWFLVATLCLAQFAVAVASGGDWMPNARFLSQVTPLLAVLIVLCAAQLSPLFARWPRSIPGLVALTALIAFALMNRSNTRAALNYVRELDQAEGRALTGMTAILNNRASRDDTVACSDIGRVGYFFKGHVLDWWGLADEEIARSGQALGHVNASTVLSRKPRFIVLYSTKPALNDSTLDHSMAVFSKAFWQSPEFRRDYKPIASLFFWSDRYHVLFEREPAADR